jgi:hypothetical protein
MDALGDSKEIENVGRETRIEATYYVKWAELRFNW